MEWLKPLVLTVIVLAALYTVIPDFFLHRLGVGSWKRQYTGGVALTFDDGPNPEITPHILNILAEYRVTACFFVTGENATKYPQLIKEIISSGHSGPARGEGVIAPAGPVCNGKPSLSGYSGFYGAFPNY